MALMDRKAFGGERGAGSAKDLETWIKLGSLRAQLSYVSTRRTNHKAIDANKDQLFNIKLNNNLDNILSYTFKKETFWHKINKKLIFI